MRGAAVVFAFIGFMPYRTAAQEANSQTDMPIGIGSLLICTILYVVLLGCFRPGLTELGVPDPIAKAVEDDWADLVSVLIKSKRSPRWPIIGDPGAAHGQWGIFQIAKDGLLPDVFLTRASSTRSQLLIGNRGRRRGADPHRYPRRNGSRDSGTPFAFVLVCVLADDRGAT